MRTYHRHSNRALIFLLARDWGVRSRGKKAQVSLSMLLHKIISGHLVLDWDVPARKHWMKLQVGDWMLTNLAHLNFHHWAITIQIQQGHKQLRVDRLLAVETSKWQVRIQLAMLGPMPQQVHIWQIWLKRCITMSCSSNDNLKVIINQPAVVSSETLGDEQQRHQRQLKLHQVKLHHKWLISQATTMLKRGKLLLVGREGEAKTRQGEVYPSWTDETLRQCHPLFHLVSRTQDKVNDQVWEEYERDQLQLELKMATSFRWSTLAWTPTILSPTLLRWLVHQGFIMCKLVAFKCPLLNSCSDTDQTEIKRLQRALTQQTTRVVESTWVV